MAYKRLATRLLLVPEHPGIALSDYILQNSVLRSTQVSLQLETSMISQSDHVSPGRTLRSMLVTRSEPCPRNFGRVGVS